DPRLDEVLPRLSADGFDDFSRNDVENVVVSVGAAEARFRFQVSQAPRNFLAVVGRGWPPEQVAGAKSKAAPMHEQVTHSQFARDVRVPHLEPRQVVDDSPVPLDFSFLDEQPERRRGECLGVGGNAEERSLVDRSARAEAADTIAPGCYRFPVFYDSDGEPR